MKQDNIPANPLPNFHPEATADIEAKIGYMRENHFPSQTIELFLTGVEEAMAKIQMNPTTWSFARGSKLTRKAQLLRFRMTAFYQIQPNGVPVILELCGPGQSPRWMNRATRPN